MNKLNIETVKETLQSNLSDQDIIQPQTKKQKLFNSTSSTTSSSIVSNSTNHDNENNINNNDQQSLTPIDEHSLCNLTDTELIFNHLSTPFTYHFVALHQIYHQLHLNLTYVNEDIMKLRSQKTFKLFYYGDMFESHHLIKSLPSYPITSLFAILSIEQYIKDIQSSLLSQDRLLMNKFITWLQLDDQIVLSPEQIISTSADKIIAPYHEHIISQEKPLIQFTTKEIEVLISQGYLRSKYSTIHGSLLQEVGYSLSHPRLIIWLTWLLQYQQLILQQLQKTRYKELSIKQLQTTYCLNNPKKSTTSSSVKLLTKEQLSFILLDLLGRKILLEKTIPTNGGLLYRLIVK